MRAWQTIVLLALAAGAGWYLFIRKPPSVAKPDGTTRPKATGGAQAPVTRGGPPNKGTEPAI